MVKYYKHKRTINYQLFLGPELFEQMLISYKDSLKRKRPDNYK